MRVEWWKQSVQVCFDTAKQIKETGDTSKIMNVPNHPLLRGILSMMMDDIELSRTHFASLFRAHSDNTRPISMDDLENYGKNSLGSVFGLSLGCLWKEYPEISPSERLDIEHCTLHLAQALSLFQLLRATPMHISNRTCYLPIQLLSEQKISLEDLFRGKADMEKFSDIIYSIASSAHIHLEHVRILVCFFFILLFTKIYSFFIEYKIKKQHSIQRN